MNRALIREWHLVSDGMAQPQESQVTQMPRRKP